MPDWLSPEVPTSYGSAHVFVNLSLLRALNVTCKDLCKKVRSIFAKFKTLACDGELMVLDQVSMGF